MDVPYGTENSTSAFLFSKTLIQSKKHKINNIFFYSHGVYNANKFLYSSDNKYKLIDNWYKLSLKFSINLNICSNSAYKRGIINNDNALDLGFSEGNLHPVFKLTGLGTLINSILTSDRMIQF